MTGAVPLITERLTLTPMTEGDAEELYPIFRDPRAMRYWHTPPHAEVADTRAMIGTLLADSAYWWTIRRREDDCVIGKIGFLGREGVPGMGYMLAPASWRRGYMTEAVRAALDFGFADLGLEGVELWIHADNLASRKLAEKVGFIRRGRFPLHAPHERTAHETIVFGMRKEEWRPDPAAPAPGMPRCYSLQPVLAVADVQATVHWYRDTLGFAIEFLFGDPPTYGAVSYADWRTEGAHIMLSQSADTPRSSSGVTLYLFVGPSIDDLYDLYRSREVTIVDPLTSFPWGQREFSIADVNGYILRFGSPG